MVVLTSSTATKRGSAHAIAILVEYYASQHKVNVNTQRLRYRTLRKTFSRITYHMYYNMCGMGEISLHEAL